MAVWSILGVQHLGSSIECGKEPAEPCGAETRLTVYRALELLGRDSFISIGLGLLPRELKKGYMTYTKRKQEEAEAGDGRFCATTLGPDSSMGRGPWSLVAPKTWLTVYRALELLSRN